ncbi:MAG TPA: response regulator [Thermoanaerobaculia bacterium]|jgi:DNA-binding response OmpR family regulator|nr:response regulator [Thermoanaerobaculia bacterium]
MVRPSCPALVVHDDDAFRKTLIAALDQQNFTVTFSSDGDGAIDLLQNRRFSVVLLGVNLASNSGTRALDFLRDSKEKLACGVLILGDPDPQIRTFAPWADETLLKPVDANYVATRARTYCDCN